MRWVVACIAVALPPAPPQSPAAPGFVGEAVCAGCHAREAAMWRGSHHQLAMQPANSSTVLGDFQNAKFSYAGIESRFFRRDGNFLARTDGPDGALHDYPIAYTFGVAPLQQYLVAFPGGRFQALEIAWDSRAQRWFHLHPGERIDSRDPLHWTGAGESWNFMCADCHSTNVRRSPTRFAEISVSCEACHGPGSLHVSWARHEITRNDRGLLIALDERRGVEWARDAGGQPRRSSPRQSQRELEMCARCHSRRAPIHEDHVHGQPVSDDYQLALLDDDLYYPDGQMQGEVYEYGSFVQSRMFAEGVTCGDCHDPHRPELRASGDNLCLRCHAEATYFTSKHHFHPQGSPGARCVSCHMPATTYMVVDARRDHSLRVPRPDLSVKLGVPNACNRCHADRSASWAARTVQKWYRHTPSGHQQFAEALAAGRDGAPGSQRLLAALVDDRRQPAIARASALERMALPLAGATLVSAGSALGDPDPLVRRAAVHILADEPKLLAPLLADPVRGVRLEAAAALANRPVPDGAALERATAELVAAEELNGDRPEAHLALATLRIKQQAFDRAEAELKRALSIDPAFVPAAVNLADLYRMLDRDREAEPLLREALNHARENPSLMYALGLVMVRQKRAPEALRWLGAAARGSNPRYAYVYAVALYSQGRKREAITRLERVLVGHPWDRDSLAALIAFHREAGNLGQAQRYAQRLAALR